VLNTARAEGRTAGASYHHPVGLEQARQHKLIVTGVSSQQLLEQADANAGQSIAQLAQFRAQAAAAKSKVDILAAKAGSTLTDYANFGIIQP
jgi:hypothetical protein